MLSIDPLQPLEPTWSAALDHRPANRPGTRPHAPARADAVFDRAEVTGWMGAFRATGGMVSGDELAYMLRRGADQPVSLVARWIVDQHVVRVDWHGALLLPLFQFDLASASVHTGVREAITVLSGPFDAWETAEWFARPNEWLGGHIPADMITLDPAATVQAARADRFVVTG